MKFDIISLFPELFGAFTDHSMIKRAISAGHIEVTVTNPRDFSRLKHHQVDDTPYGGGSGMLMMAPPIFEAVEAVKEKDKNLLTRTIFLGPAGPRFTQEKAKELALYDRLVLICGHYEGVDYRVEEHLADETISIGDFVVTGGEVPAMLVVDAVARMIPGVLGATGGAEEDSFYKPLLEHPQYTKPYEYRGMVVPEVLLSGHHKNIASWRLKEALIRTLRIRPDLLKRELSGEEEKILKEIQKEQS